MVGWLMNALALPYQTVLYCVKCDKSEYVIKQYRKKLDGEWRRSEKKIKLIYRYIKATIM